MDEHAQFDRAVDAYVRFNTSAYNRQVHIERTRSVVEAGHRLLRALDGEHLDASPPNGSLEEAALWALHYFEGVDRANAQMHCAPVRYSPITFRIALALHDAWPPTEPPTEDLARVLQHVGAYTPDPGR